MISRFLINLRSAQGVDGSSVHGASAQSPDELSIPNFRIPNTSAGAVIDPMGGPLDYRDGEEADAQDEDTERTTRPEIPDAIPEDIERPVLRDPGFDFMQ